MQTYQFQPPNVTISPASSAAVLEDFSSIRNNGDGTPLWAPYLGENSGQTGSLLSGTYKLHVAGNGASYLHFYPYPYVWPQGFAQSWLRSGTFSPTCNRLNFWVKGGKALLTKFEFGTYIKPHSDTNPVNQGQHFYHFVEGNWKLNKWHFVSINRRPQHQVGGDSNYNWPDNPTAGTVNYFDGLNRFYFNNPYDNASGDWYFDDFTFSTVAGEPDDLVASVMAVYEGTRYALHWASIKNTTKVYDVAYKTSSMKVSGFASGTSGGSVTNPGSAYVDCHWFSPAMSENAGGMYIAIRPQGRTDFTEIFLPVRT